jgi:hypothetical protein
MRIRYVLILVAMVVVAALGFELLRRESLQPRNLEMQTRALPAADPAEIERLARLPMPVQATELGAELDRLEELQQADLLGAIRAYATQQGLAEAIGEPSDRVETIGAAREWFAAHPTRVADLAQRLLRDSLEITLAASDVAPPKLGRDGVSYHLSFAAVGEGLWRAQPSAGMTWPYYVAVVNVHNRLRLPLESLAFAVLPRGDVALPRDARLPEASVLACGQNSWAAVLEIPPGATLPMVCRVGIPLIERVPVEALLQLMRALRSGPLEPWVKQLGATIPGSARKSKLEVSDRGVDAEHGHGPSSRVEAVAFAVRTPDARPPRNRPEQLTCEERRDCPGQRFEDVKNVIVLPMLLVATLVPGYLVAGLQILLRRKSRVLPLLLFGGFAGFAVISLRPTLNSAGGGYGGYLVITVGVCAAIGYWVGYAIGRWAGRPIRHMAG